MAVKTCALPGCSKSLADSPPDHLACGETHHLLLMAGRYNPSLPHPHQAILDRNNAGLCALPSCSESPCPGDSWCSRTHYLDWLSVFYTRLSPQQVCKLRPDCTRHVFVPDGGLPSEFCGWRHRQKFEMRKALQLPQRQQLLHTQEDHGHVNSVESHNLHEDQGHVLSLESHNLQEDHGHAPSVESLMRDVQQFAVDQVIPTKVSVDNEFFDKHPWEVLGEQDTCFLIARCKFISTSKKNQRKMITKDHYHWKQQGKPKDKGGYTRKYFTYKKLKGKKKAAVEHYEDNLYTMKEYTKGDCESYVLIKLRKGVKRRKGGFDFRVSHDNGLPPLLDSSEELSPLLDSFSEEQLSLEGVFAVLSP